MQKSKFINAKMEKPGIFSLKCQNTYKNATSGFAYVF